MSPSLNPSPSSPATTLRSLLAAQTHTHCPPNTPALLVPGVHDGLAARLAQSLSLPALYLPTGALSLNLGLPALGLLTATEIVSAARGLPSSGTPVIVDLDTGLGPPLAIARTAAALMEAGVAAVHINDKLLEQRKGFRDGRNLCSREEFVARIRAVVLARERSGRDLVVIAESYAARYIGVEEAVERLERAVEIGADGLFPAGMSSRDECRGFGEALRATGGFLVCAMVAGARNGVKVTAAEAKEMGYSMVLYAGVCISPAFLAMKEALENLMANGDCDEVPPEASARQMMELCGMSEQLQFDKDVGGDEGAQL